MNIKLKENTINMEFFISRILLGYINFHITMLNAFNKVWCRIYKEDLYLISISNWATNWILGLGILYIYIYIYMTKILNRIVSNIKTVFIMKMVWVFEKIICFSNHTKYIYLQWSNEFAKTKNKKYGIVLNIIHIALMTRANKHICQTRKLAAFWNFF